MPHQKSAAKRHRQSVRRAERNLARRSAARTAVRSAREAIESGDEAAAAAAVREAGAILDRTASKGVIHANNAARRKSRLAKQMRGMGTAKAEAPKKGTARKATARKKAPARSRAKKS